jgi:hypothetical protein
VLDTSEGSLLVGLTASSAEPPAGPALREFHGRGSLPSASFLAISESLVNEVARRRLSERTLFHARSGGNVRRLLESEAIYALIPGLRTIDAKEQLDFEVDFREAPRLEFRNGADGRAVIRVLVSGVDIAVRRQAGGTTTRLGTLHIESGQMAAVPFTNVLGGISFRVVENRWRVFSTGLEFDDELVAATLQEIAFGKLFETTYDPLLTRDLRIGDTEFVPRSFAAVDGYLVIGLEERPQRELPPSAAAATRTDFLLESR